MLVILLIALLFAQLLAKVQDPSVARKLDFTDEDLNLLRKHLAAMWVNTVYYSFVDFRLVMIIVI